MDKKYTGLVRELNPGPRAPEARIIPLDQRATSYVMAQMVGPLAPAVLFCEEQKGAIDSGGIRTHAPKDWCLKPAP